MELWWIIPGSMEAKNAEHANGVARRLAEINRVQINPGVSLSSSPSASISGEPRRSTATVGGPVPFLGEPFPQPLAWSEVSEFPQGHAS